MTLPAVSALSVTAGVAVTAALPAGLSWISLDAALTALGLVGAGLGGAGVYLGVRLRRDAQDMRTAFRVASGKIARLETQVAQLAQAEPAVPQSLKTSLAELSAEIGLLGGLMRDVAETVAVHDRAIEGIAERSAQTAVVARAAMAKPPQATPEPAAVPQREAPTPPKPSRPDATGQTIDQAPLHRNGPDRRVTEPVLPQAALRADRQPAMADVRPAPPPPPSPEPMLMPEAMRAEVPAPQPLHVNEPARDDARADLMAEAALDDRAELYLQPIVALPQRRVKMYEVLGRIRLGENDLLMPAEFLPVIERRGLAPAFDERTIRRAFLVARHLAGRGSDALVCCNLSPVSIAAPGFLRALSRLIGEFEDVAPRLVLDMSQAAMRQLDAERLGALGEIAAQGVSLAIDHVADFRFDPPSLADRGVRFVKMPVRMLLGVDRQSADIDILDLGALLGRAGIALVAEHVESEDAVRDLLDLDVPFAQGFLFAVPRPVKPEVFKPETVRPDHMPEEASAVASLEAAAARQPERKPFRSFLRRAATA